DPAPRYQRFFSPAIGEGSPDVEEAGVAYVNAAYRAVKNWVATVPEGEPIAVAFSGGIDSTSVFLLARKVLEERGGDPNRVRAFTLDLGGGKDAEQAAETVRALGFHDSWEV